MKYLSALVIVLATGFLVACGGRQEVVHVDHDPPPSGDDYVPILRAFHLIDSYGVNTEYDHQTELTLDPYHDAGLFEIDWRVDSLEDYLVEFRVNDRARVAGSREVYSEICGLGLSCDQGAIRLCQYYPDLTMACGLDETVTDISAMVYTLPQTLYAIVRVCDLNSDYCEFDYYPVWVE